jgi:hypothetical protein
LQIQTDDRLVLDDEDCVGFHSGSCCAFLITV